jgi:hypothetical protein
MDNLKKTILWLAYSKFYCVILWFLQERIQSGEDLLWVRYDRMSEMKVVQTQSVRQMEKRED